MAPAAGAAPKKVFGLFQILIKIDFLKNTEVRYYVFFVVPVWKFVSIEYFAYQCRVDSTSSRKKIVLLFAGSLSSSRHLPKHPRQLPLRLPARLPPRCHRNLLRGRRRVQGGGERRRRWRPLRPLRGQRSRVQEQPGILQVHLPARLQLPCPAG